MYVTEVVEKINSLDGAIDDLYYTKRRLEKYKGYEFEIRCINEIGNRLTREKSELENKLKNVSIL